MPRGNRYRLAGHVWHLTERCHRGHFLLKFARDRRAWTTWLCEARKRFGLAVLNYQVTSNHVHLLVLDRGGDEIACSMQLIAGCVGRAYNRRKRRAGAFWADCYHATAVDTDEHPARCFTYIDLNMVRAGVVDHPRYWLDAGYHEIQQPPARYRIIDREALCGLLGTSEGTLATLQHEWIEAAFGTDVIVFSVFPKSIFAPSSLFGFETAPHPASPAQECTWHTLALSAIINYSCGKGADACRSARMAIGKCRSRK